MILSFSRPGIMYKFSGILILLSVAVFSVKAQYVSLNNNEVIKLKALITHDNTVQKQYNALKKLADQALTEDPSPIETVVSEGHLSTDPLKIASGKALKDIDKIHALSLVYRIEENKIYLDKEIVYLMAWAKGNRPEGNPINDTKFEQLFFGYDLIKDVIPITEKTVIEAWLSKIADEEIKTGKNKSKITSFNNWNSHRLKIIGCAGYVLNNKSYKEYIEKELPIQVEKNLYADGSGFDLKQRDALHYQVYTLEPLIALATIIIRSGGIDYYNYVSPSGASIKNSLNFLIPFVTGEKTHPEYVNSQVAFDKKRADNNEPGFHIGANFVPKLGINVLIQAAYFQPECLDLVRSVTNNKTDFPSWQAVLNAVRK